MPGISTCRFSYHHGVGTVETVTRALERAGVEPRHVGAVGSWIGRLSERPAQYSLHLDLAASVRRSVALEAAGTAALVVALVVVPEPFRIVAVVLAALIMLFAALRLAQAGLGLASARRRETSGGRRRFRGMLARDLARRNRPHGRAPCLADRTVDQFAVAVDESDRGLAVSLLRYRAVAAPRRFRHPRIARSPFATLYEVTVLERRVFSADDIVGAGEFRVVLDERALELEAEAAARALAAEEEAREIESTKAALRGY